MGLECRPVRSGKELRKFIDFPHDLYKSDPYYVPEVYLGQKAMFDTKKYPFYQYGRSDLFLVWEGKNILGRIASIHNPRYNQYHGTNIGFFGFFDCVNREDVASLLLNCVKSQAKARGHDSILGPMNYTTNETAGVLIEGFTSPPYVLMTHNFPYYQVLLERHGFQKEMDLLAYALTPDKVSEKSIRLLSDLESRLLSKGISIRKANIKNLKKEADTIKTIYNQAWEKNWGFVPFTDAEFDYLTKDLSPVIDPDFTFIAEKEGKPVGFSITVPNLNEILIKNKRGRLLPWGIFRILFGKKRTKTVRILALGVLPEFRKSGVESVFYARTILAARERNKTGAEASWILENNAEMNAGLVNLQGKVYKKYRLYSASLQT